MSIWAIGGLAIVTAALSLSIRRQSPETALFLSVGAGVIILLAVLRNILGGVGEIAELLAAAGINAEYIMVLLKVLGICFVTEFCCDCCSEAGMETLSMNLSLAGKMLVLLTALPLFRQVMEVVVQLSGG